MNRRSLILIVMLTIGCTWQTAVAEVWELGAFFFQQVLGPLHSGDIQAAVAMINALRP